MAGYFYILFSKTKCLYNGVTSDLVGRVYKHKKKMFEGFTKKYNVDQLGYFEVYDRIEDAIEREKAIKGSSRARKIKLIEKENPERKDLYDDICK